MVAIKFETKGLDSVSKRLHEQVERAKNLAPVLQPIAAALKTHIDNSFRRSVGPDGENWEPLAQSTVAGRRGRSNVPLVDTGTMRNAAYAMVEGNDAIVFGDNVAYVGPQQFGAEIKGTYKVGPKQKVGRKYGPISPVQRGAARKARKTRLGPAVNRKQYGPGNRDLYASAVGPRWQNNNQLAARNSDVGRDGSYTIKIPARPFLPVNKDGSIIFKNTPLENLNERVLEYIRSGKKSGK